MTHINQINETTQPLTPSSGRTNAKKESSGSFETLLNKAVDKSEGASMETASIKELNEILSPGPVIPDTTGIVSGQTDTLLNLLDEYALKLENPGVSLRSIAPVLEEINQNAGNLLKETENLTAEDTRLKQIATQAAVTAQTEYVKFQRGDYLS